LECFFLQDIEIITTIQKMYDDLSSDQDYLTKAIAVAKNISSNLQKQKIVAKRVKTEVGACQEQLAKLSSSSGEMIWAAHQELATKHNIITTWSRTTFSCYASAGHEKL
jgi:hypothetical protein